MFIIYTKKTLLMLYVQGGELNVFLEIIFPVKVTSMIQNEFSVFFPEHKVVYFGVPHSIRSIFLVFLYNLFLSEKF